jgi:hypothetical protein
MTSFPSAEERMTSFPSHALGLSSSSSQLLRPRSAHGPGRDVDAATFAQSLLRAGDLTWELDNERHLRRAASSTAMRRPRSAAPARRPLRPSRREFENVAALRVRGMLDVTPKELCLFGSEPQVVVKIRVPGTPKPAVVRRWVKRELAPPNLANPPAAMRRKAPAGDHERPSAADALLNEPPPPPAPAPAPAVLPAKKRGAVMPALALFASSANRARKLADEWASVPAYSPAPMVEVVSVRPQPKPEEPRHEAVAVVPTAPMAMPQPGGRLVDLGETPQRHRGTAKVSRGFGGVLGAGRTQQDTPQSQPPPIPPARRARGRGGRRSEEDLSSWGGGHGEDELVHQTVWS